MSICAFRLSQECEAASNFLDLSHFCLCCGHKGIFFRDILIDIPEKQLCMCVCVCVYIYIYIYIYIYNLRVFVLKYF